MTTPSYVTSVGAGVQDGGDTTVTSPSITPSGNNRVALIHVTNSDSSPAAVTAVTLNGNACTQLGTTHNVATFWNQSLWYYKNPAASAMTATATFASPQGERLIQVAIYSDVDQSATFGTPKQTTAGSVDDVTNTAIDAAVGDLVVHSILAARGSNPDTNSIDPDGGETERIETATSPTAFDDAAIADKVAASTSETGAFTVNPASSAPDGWGVISVAVKGASGDVTASGSGQIATATAPSGSAGSPGTATGDGVTATASAPTGSAGVAVDAIGAGVTDAATAPSATAAEITVTITGYRLIGKDRSPQANLSDITALVHQQIPSSLATPDKFIDGLSTDSEGVLSDIDISDIQDTGAQVFLTLLKAPNLATTILVTPVVT